MEQHGIELSPLGAGGGADNHRAGLAQLFEGQDALDEQFGDLVIADLVIVEMQEQVGDEGGGGGWLGLAQEGHHLVAGLGAGDGDVVLEDAVVISAGAAGHVVDEELEVEVVAADQPADGGADRQPDQAAAHVGGGEGGGTGDEAKISWHN